MLPNNNNIDDLKNWAEQMACAMTVCDKDCKILFMNELSRKTFAKHGDIIGHNLMDYHGERAQKMIRHMLDTGDTNAYTISKAGQRKLVYQTPWRVNGEVAGLVELSIPLPADLPHYDRDAAPKAKP